MTGLDRTLSLLRETANEAAVPVLAAALESSDPLIQDDAFQTMLERHHGVSQQRLIERWHRLSERWRLQIAQHPGWVSHAVRGAICSTDPALCANGCNALLYIREFDLIPALAARIDQVNHPHVPLVAETLLSLCELLQEEVAGPRDRPRLQDPARICDRVLPSLERGLESFSRHHCREVVEAFLVLASSENPVLKQVLAEPRHPAYLVMVDVLRSSPRMAIVRLILNMLENRFAPPVALHVVAHRTDMPFVRKLLKRVTPDMSEALKSNLRRVEAVAWLQQSPRLLNTLTEQEEAAALRLAVTTNMNRLQAFEVLRHVLQSGRIAGRRLAAAALAEFGGAEANELVLHALEDADPQVQASVVVQLRDRGIPGAISQLIQLLNSRHEIVCEAARSCLKEFTFDRYITAFDLMDEKIRRSTGLLVMRVDPQATAGLAAELKSRMRTRRLRALEVAMAMDAVPIVEPLIIKLLTDPDHFVRAEAARALGYCNSPLTIQSLEHALNDHSVAVREAAEQSLQKLSAAGHITTAGSLTVALADIEGSPLIDATAADAGE
jgi:HEAT repeat protein